VFCYLSSRPTRLSMICATRARDPFRESQTGNAAPKLVSTRRLFPSKGPALKSLWELKELQSGLYYRWPNGLSGCIFVPRLTLRQAIARCSE